MDCIFCKIVDGSIPSNKVYEDDKMLAFHDIEPQAPVHVVMIPKAHTISSANDITADNSEIISYIFSKIPEIAKLLNLDSYRIVNNCGPDAGQTVFHIHFHLMGGDKLGKMA